MSDHTTVGLQWLNNNAVRSYPISEDASGKDISGGYTLPDDFIVDLTISVPDLESGLYKLTNFCITHVHVFSGGTVVNIGYDNSDGSVAGISNDVVVLASISIPPTHTQNETYSFSGVGSFRHTTGAITIGKLDTIVQNPGSFRFNKAGARFVSTLLAPSFAGVTSIRISNRGVLSEPISGGIILDAGTNASITIEPVTVGAEETPRNRIIINAIDGTGNQEDCGCGSIDNDERQCITSLNGAGTVTLNGSGCATVTGGGSHTISIADDCAEPCCGSSELDAIIADQNVLATEVRSQFFLMQRLEARLGGLANLGEAILASGLVTF